MFAGPATGGLFYVIRLWARDEHAWAWSDFWQGFKENWRQGLVMMLINGLAMFLLFLAFNFYLTFSLANPIYNVAVVQVAIMALFFGMMNLFIFPLMVPLQVQPAAHHQKRLLAGDEPAALGAVVPGRGADPAGALSGGEHVVLHLLHPHRFLPDSAGGLFFSPTAPLTGSDSHTHGIPLGAHTSPGRRGDAHATAQSRRLAFYARRRTEV